MSNNSNETEKQSFFNENQRDLLARFLSILLTALISALITFLQTLVVPVPVDVSGSEQMAQAGTLGAAIRGALEFMKVSNRA